MEGSLNVLKDYQKVIIKALTNFKKSPKDRLTLEYLEIRLDLLEKDWSSFKDANTKLHESFDLEDVEEEVDKIYDTTEETYITYKCQIKTMLGKLHTSEYNVRETIQQTSTTSKPNSFVKLPRISIPTFSGKYDEWTTFHDLFISLVHKNEALDNVQRLHYLKTHLTGEAEQLIRHTPVTSANYLQCWELLIKRYNNKKYLANCILNRLFAQKRVLIESAEVLKGILDTTTDCLNALTNLNIDVSTWDTIIIHIITFKLDPETRKQWELHNNNDSNNELPTLDQFKTFIENRFRALECISPKRSQHQVSKGSQVPYARAMLATTPPPNFRCEYCSESHKLCFCKAFSKQPIENRRDFVAKNRICFNCLGSNHTVYNCKKLTSCKLCHKRHHSLLHISREPENTKNATTPFIESTSPSTSTSPIVSCLSTGRIAKPGQVLLATALIKAESHTGQYQIIRALLDQGSQACFITEATVQLLNLKKISIYGQISGLGDNKSTLAKHMVRLTIMSQQDPDFKLNVNAYVLPKITSYLPERSTCMKSFDWVHINNLKLADPNFNVPNKIDLLLGADAYSCIIKEGIVKSPFGSLIAQNTALGWVLSGTSPVEFNETEDRKNNKRHINVMHAHIEEDNLKKFWEIEEDLFTEKILTPEELKCEEFYKNTTKKDTDGRYVVKLPFREDPPHSSVPGNSRAIAERRFKSLEKRLDRDLDLKKKYAEVITEYLRLGHMRLVTEPDNKREKAVYLPHHAVIREDKSTTKVRVVFNASEKNCDGISLNDTLMVGPTLQADLRHTVTRWRAHSIALVADIVKMYRQVRVAKEDTMYQRMLWRDSCHEPIKDYELLTVTFGTASAPYQAVKTLQQIANDEGRIYPSAKDMLLNCFYMDDLMTGCSSVDEGVEIYTQITSLLQKGGFTLQKWNTNNNQILEQINIMENNRTKISKDDKDNKENNRTKISKDDKDNKENNSTLNTMEKEVEIKLDSTIKILGLTWNRNADTFQYCVNLPPPTTAPVTKRSIISDIARLFDPLGWLAPSVVVAKIFIQRLWLTGVGWDDALPKELTQEWSTYRKELSLLTSVRVPRWLGTTSDDELELHGFCDASKSAYAAAVYLRVIKVTGEVHLSLLVAKTRVAPIKQVSIPRLELCGAVLLSKLLTESAQILNIKDDKISAWTDSTVVLAWLSSHPSRWKTFVANRTSEILTTMKSSQWYHVPTSENPADCASRGLLPSLFLENTMWFSGPSLLKKGHIEYKRSTDLETDLEQSIKTHIATVPESSLFERFSNLAKMLRVIAYCRRFLTKIKNKNYIQKTEIDEALECCIKVIQREVFTSEYKELQTKGYITIKNSKLKSLCPFLDDKGIMRARGRIEKSSINEFAKHPIILPNSNHFTHLVVADSHVKTLHGGPQVMANYIRSAYWILGAKNVIKQHVRKCVTCAKQKAVTRNQFMGSLPSVRCTPARPFINSGVDYAGPINIRTTKGRGHRSYKGYICLFVCMATRALHLEVVSDMSTQAFLAAFKRFVSRRGHCAKIWSDNGTTFVGASRELKQLSSIQLSIAEQLEAQGTEWHFIPPHSPNFGGLWEAGVKSTKFHLKRVIGDSTLTYEEMSTLLIQIEACLNSRPMSVINGTDPSEPLPLTPGHFLIGEPIVNVPENNYTNANISHLTRWQMIQRMMQTFWSRWSQEYISNLMNRYKWSFQTPEPKIGDIVLIKEDDLPPCRWLLGRITEKHPGIDNITRVVTIRTKSAVLKRPTSKLCILPISE